MRHISTSNQRHSQKKRHEVQQTKYMPCMPMTVPMTPRRPFFGKPKDNNVRHVEALAVKVRLPLNIRRWKKDRKGCIEEPPNCTRRCLYGAPTDTLTHTQVNTLLRASSKGPCLSHPSSSATP